jgi:hypothetical protein
MRNIKHPSQTELFDPVKDLPPSHRKNFLESPEGVIRAVILEVLPVTELAKSYSKDIGRPTKELYSMAGLIQLMEFKDWTVEEAVSQFMWNDKVHLALNVSSTHPELNKRTLYRFMEKFRDNDNRLAQLAMDNVTKALIEIAELDISKQRLDSTHVLSNMATFGRTRTMGVTIKRFLTQVIRHDNDAYLNLDEELRKRYAPSQGKLFADTVKSKTKDRYSLLRIQVAEDMHALISIFENNDQFNTITSFKNMVRVFNDQCEISDDKITLKKKTGGDVIQNPSDPDATYDGHKGAGYQVQYAETCSEDNEIQLITSAVPQTASVSDKKSVEVVIDDLERNELLPDEMLSDAAYGSDKNIVDAAKRGVEIVSPTKKNADLSAQEDESCSQLSLDDFVIDEASEIITACPAGHKPTASEYDSEKGQTITVMPDSACRSCEFVMSALSKRYQESFV